MCLEEYTQEYADKLHRYELEEAKKETEEANNRAYAAEKKTEEAKKEVNKLKEELLKNGYSLEKINELISETM